MFYIYVGDQQIYKPLDDLLIIFNPRLTLELGKAGSLEFDIPPDNPYYGRLSQLSTEVSVDMDDEELFHGRVLSNELAFNNVRHIYCEGDLSYLIDSVQKGVQYSGTTHELFRRIIANHNARMDASKRFTVGNINIENRNIVLVGQSESENVNTGNIDYKQIAIDSIVDDWNNTFDYIQTCLIDYCGGYLRTRRVNGTIYIDLLSNFANTSIQAIELGSNLLDLKEQINAQDLFTVLIPLGDDNLTIASVNGGSDELVDTNAVARYGRIIKTHVFNNVTSASTLLENARRFMATNVNVPRTISVRAVDLHMLNPLISPIRIGDKVTITSAAHDVDDALTCTRIEYDLERPENNNYTFGNPVQTLTQRYREDARLSNDTYGNSAAVSSAGAATPSAASAKGASAAAAAAKTAKKEREKDLNDFYDAWVNFDPDQATVSLGALSKQYFNGKEVLLSQCGIDLDGKTGNINIQSMHNVVDDHGHKIAENEAHINVVETDTAVAIESVTDRVEHLAGEEAQHYTAITQRADTLGSSIDLLAKDVHEFEDHTTTALGNINITTNDHEARITSNTRFITNVDGTVKQNYTDITQRADELGASINSVAGRVDEHGISIAQITQTVDENRTSIGLVAEKATANGKNIAAIQVWATDKETVINAKADLLVVDTKFNDLTSGVTQAKLLNASEIKANSISIWSEDSPVATPVPTMNHAHTISAEEGDDGKVTIKIGIAKTEYPQKASFDIAKTKKYTAGVAAVNVKTVEAMSYSSTGDFTAELADSYVRYSNEQIVGRVRVTLNNNNQKNIVVKMAGVRAFTAGKESVTVSTLGYNKANSSDPGWTYDTNTKKYTIKVKATLSSGKNPKETTVTLDASQQITAAIDGVTVSTLGYNKSNSYDPGWTYDTNTKKYTVKLKATLSSGKNPKETTVTLDASQQISDATNAGIASVDALASSNNIGYETDEDGATDYNHIWIKLENNKMIGSIALPSGGGGNVSIELGSYGSQAANANYPYYYQNSAGTLGTIKAVAKRGSSQIASADLDVTGLIQYVYNSGGGGSGGSSYYYWSDEKSGPYGSKQRDCYFVIGDSIVHTAKVIWSTGNPTFQ